jgi:hypothetical protein
LVLNKIRDKAKQFLLGSEGVRGEGEGSRKARE